MQDRKACHGLTIRGDNSGQKIGAQARAINVHLVDKLAVACTGHRTQNLSSQIYGLV